MGRYVPVRTFQDLQRGAIIKNRGSERVYVVTGNYGDRAIAVATVDVTHLSEWDRFEDNGGSERG